jgi:hypothetical protein
VKTGSKFQGGVKMKKFAIVLVLCLAIIQPMYAATSALVESLLEYEAITSAIGSNPCFQNVIPQIQFIVDIQRITKQVNVLGEVKYKILTRVPNIEPVEAAHKKSHCKKDKKNPRLITYIATLNVAPNPGIGPNIVTVESIVLAHGHHRK